MERVDVELEETDNDESVISSVVNEWSNGPSGSTKNCGHNGWGHHHCQDTWCGRPKRNITRHGPRYPHIWLALKQKGVPAEFRVVSRNGSKRNINITRTDDHEYTKCWADIEPLHWALNASVDRVHCLFQTTDNALRPDIETVGAMIFKRTTTFTELWLTPPKGLHSFTDMLYE